MALRYNLPECVGDLRPAVDLRVPPLLRQPVEVEFRRGANMAEVVADMLGSVSVKVNAAVGAGKSTLLPKELALVGKTLVFHVVPNPILAFDLYTYVAKCADESGRYPAVDIFRSYDQDFPKIGVLFMSSAQFVGLLLRERSLSAYKDCVVFLDEAHESDAYTHVVRNLSLPMGAGVLVQASATFGASDFRPRESAGSVVEGTYASEDIMEKWDPMDSGKPWSFSRVDNNIIVYTDSRSQYRALAAAYEPAGFIVYRLEAGMSEELYARAKADLVNPRGALVMLVADSTFRSGFSFMAGTIMDSGRVSYFDPTPGKLLKRSRAIFQSEAEQTAGRGGRFKGMKTCYYRPDIELQPVVCDLEGVEMEAAAYLYRVLGFKPVRELSRTIMGEYDLPSDIAFTTAINGTYPLTYYIVDGKGQVREGAQPAGAAAPGAIDVEASSSPADCDGPGVAGQPGGARVDDDCVSLASDCCSERSDSRAWSGDSECATPDSGQNDLQARLWTALFGLAGGDEVARVELGRLCAIRGLGRKDSRYVSGMFPRGLDSVLALFGPGTNGNAGALGLYDRKAALHMVLDRYNVCAVEVMAGGKALQDTAADVVASCNYPAARDYFSRVVEAIARYDLELSTLFDVLSLLTTGVMQLEELKGAADFVSKRAAEYVKEFEFAFAHPEYDGSHAGIALRESLRGVPLNSALPKFPPFESRAKKRVSFGVPGDECCCEDDVLGVLRLRSPSVVSDVSVSSDFTDVVVKPPRWMGFKDVTYTASANGDVSRITVRPGKLLRVLGAKRVYEC